MNKDRTELENLKIYHQYIELINYTYMILEKYPKNAKTSVGKDILNYTFSGMKNIISTYKYYDKEKKINCLTNLDIDLKMLKVLIRVSYKKKYINIRNYEAWSKKLNNLGALLGGWINSCVKQ